MHDGSHSAHVRDLRRIRQSGLMWGTLLAFFPMGRLEMLLKPPGWLMTFAWLLWFGSFAGLAVAHGPRRFPACHRFYNVRTDWDGHA